MKQKDPNPAPDPDINAGYQEETYRIWKPDVGDVLDGTYEGSEDVPSPLKDGQTFRTHTIVKADTGEAYTVAGAMLDKPFARLAKGTVVRVIFEGTEDLDDGRRMKYYRLLSKRPS